MLEFKAPTNRTQKVKLDSSIQLITWSKSNAASGSMIGIEVLTNFVGNNSDISIDISDKSGKKFDTIKGKISGNAFWLNYTIPENARDELYAEVKLPKHGLTSRSQSLYLVPPVILKNLKWDKSEVHRDDILKLSADVIGVPDGTEAIIAIWEQTSINTKEQIVEFISLVKKSKVENEWELQYPGDVKDIPIAGETPDGYFHPGFFFSITVANVKADSDVIKFFDFLDFQLLDAFKKPVASVEYILHLPDGTKRSGKADESGKAFEDKLAPGRIKIEIKGLENTEVR